MVLRVQTSCHRSRVQRASGIMPAKVGCPGSMILGWSDVQVHGPVKGRQSLQSWLWQTDHSSPQVQGGGSGGGLGRVVSGSPSAGLRWAGDIGPCSRQMYIYSLDVEVRLLSPLPCSWGGSGGGLGSGAGVQLHNFKFDV